MQFSAPGCHLLLHVDLSESPKIRTQLATTITRVQGTLMLPKLCHWGRRVKGFESMRQTKNIHYLVAKFVYVAVSRTLLNATQVWTKEKQKYVIRIHRREFTRSTSPFTRMPTHSALIGIHLYSVLSTWGVRQLGCVICPVAGFMSMQQNTIYVWFAL